jgi:pyruvate carboxylase
MTGYGFLSENYEFAKNVEKAGLIVSNSSYGTRRLDLVSLISF